MTLRDDHLTPHPRHFSSTNRWYAEAMARHAAAIEAKQAGYLDPATDRFVFTATCLAERPCCGSGCRHCPYDPPGRG